MNIKYFFGAVLSLPLLPIMYLQGKKIISSVPTLPEATGTEGHTRQEVNSERALEVIAIGESTIAGVGVATHEEGFAGTFAREISENLGRDVNWKVYARNGYTARRVTYKIIPKIKEQYADLIIVGLGGNDAFTLNSPSRWTTDIRNLIETIQKKLPEATIVFCNMPPIKEFPAFTSLIKFTVGNLVEILGEELKKIVEDYDNVHYSDEKITLESWMKRYNLKGRKEDFFSDGVHPSKLTYQVWAKDLAHKIHQNQEIRFLR